MRRIIIAVLFLYGLVFTHAKRFFKGRGLQEDDSLTFLVTYRDFLPTSCFYEVDNSTLEQISIDAWNGFTATDQNNCALLVDNSDWRAAINDGVISGHPDMNSNGQKVSLPAPCNAAGRLPAASCQFESDAPDNQQIILGDTVDDKSGIPKPVYCLPEDEDRCGFLLDGDGLVQTQSQKKFFDVWFEDDLKFNKRIGQKLIFNRDPDDENSFSFDSDNDDDAPDGDLASGFFPLARFKIGADSVDVDDFTDPRDAPAWPQAFVNDGGADNDDVGYWMTTELHTSFQYLESEPMVFEFSGDDDFWAFINGQMAVDLGGTHRALDATIDLNEEFEGVTFATRLGLVDGGVYALDIYHAERNIFGSNFAVTTNLFPACNVVQSGTVALDLSEGTDDEGFEDLFDTFNVELLSDTSFKLADATKSFSSSFIFTKTSENVGRGFVANFRAEISAASDGFAFVVQNRGNTDYPLSNSGNFNLFGVTNSFAVVFDFCPNRDEDEFALCSGQEVRIHHQDSFEIPNIISNDTKIVEEDYVRSDGNRFNAFDVEIVYFGGNPNFLEVYIDESLYLRENDFLVENILGGLGGFVGFTSSSGFEASDVTITDFKLTTVEVDPTKSERKELDATATAEIFADGNELAEGISFQTFDFCDNIIDTGTLAEFADAVFVRDTDEVGRRLQDDNVSNFEEGLIVDNNDGSYSAFLKTTVPGNYSVHVTFGEDCKLEVEEVDGTLEVVLVSSTPDECFQDSLTSVASVLEVVEDEDDDSELEENDANDQLTLIFASGGGGVCCLAFIGAILFAFYRAKWKKNEEFVETGANFKLEMNTKYQTNNEYARTGKALLDSQQEILALQSAAAQDTRSDEISRLQNENNDMKNMLRDAKQKTQQQSNNPRYSGSAAQSSKKKRKQEF